MYFLSRDSLTACGSVVLLAITKKMTQDVALGGALGGVFVNLVAAVMFEGYWELPLSLVLV